jgi:DNA-binding transcriptional LysR family regulator
MELRHLRYFVAVAEELHFRRAAERLHVAQPAISEQIRKLEAELGVTLLNRTHRDVSLTAPGAALLEEARVVLRQADVAVRVARTAQQRQLGRLRIGYLADSTPASIPQALARFHTAAPGIEVLLQSGPSLRLAKDVRGGSLDLAVLCLPAPVGDLRVTSLGTETAVVALPTNDRLASYPSVSPAQIGERPLVLLPRAQNPGFHDGVIATWRTAGLVPSYVDTAQTDIGHAQLAVASGAGFAVLPASSAERMSVPGVSILPLEPGPSCELAIISRHDTSTTVAAFVSLAVRLADAATKRQRFAALAA